MQIESSTDRSDTFDSLLQRSIRTAIALRKRGIQKGDIVLSFSNNHLNDCVPFLASYFLGAIPCALDPIYGLSEATRLLEQVQPKIVFTIPEKLEIIENAVKKLTSNAEIVVFGTSALHTEFETFCQEQEGETEFQPIFITNPKETAAIFFSSGSSGLPKGICVTHYNFIRQSGLVPPYEIEDLDVERKAYEESKFMTEFSFLTYSPMCWITGGNMLFNSIFLGVCRTLGQPFNPKEFWNILEKI
ncbi:hypothetical protein NQ314_011093 [Rhamnusium bicolor]|uniref:AMP-dependent synthetase/ligase domain-containing protein n=1 Tax=Rhamnusium bicolor TaxID=1586634 RepID=A0AAV8XKU2_9CUCU|nr:hypothetical protein NQ314_011093 [Rhamnusium bicolor]